MSAVVLVCVAGVATPSRPGAQAPAPVPTIAVAGPSRPTGSAAMSGVVTDAVTGRPVAGAVVTLSTADKTVVTPPRALTDSRGRFVFLSLPASEGYSLGAERFGYAYTRYGWAAPGGSRAIADISRIALAEGQWRNDVRIPLWRWGAISGRVVDERGEPVVGVVVRAFTTGRIAGNTQLVAGPLATTDDRGAYRLSGLRPGRYVVSVLSVQSTVLSTTPDFPQERPLGELAAGGISGRAPYGVAGPTIDVVGRHRLALTNFATPPPPEGVAARAYRQMFFPGATASDAAQPIEIKYGDTRTGIDFQLHPVSTFRVSGRVDPPTGVLPRLLRLMPAGSERLGFGSEAATTVLEPDGRFTFLNVPAGHYTLLAQPSVIEFSAGVGASRMPIAPGYEGTGAGVGALPGAPGLGYLARTGPPVAFWGRASVSVGEQDIDDFVLELRPTSTIRGRVAFADGTRVPAPDTRIEFYLVPATGDPSAGQLVAYTERGDRTFAFTVAGLLGATYLVGPIYPHTAGSMIATPGTYHVVSVMHQGRDLKETGFDASASAEFSDVVVTLTDKRIDVSGVVQGQSGLAAATVVLFPVERERWTNFGWHPARILSARSSSTGAYQVRGLPAGDYHVIAVPMMEPAEWMTPEFFAAAAPRSTRLSVAWGDTPAVNLTVVEVARP